MNEKHMHEWFVGEYYTHCLMIERVNISWLTLIPLFLLFNWAKSHLQLLPTKYKLCQTSILINCFYVDIGGAESGDAKPRSTEAQEPGCPPQSHPQLFLCCLLGGSALSLYSRLGATWYLCYFLRSYKGYPKEKGREQKRERMRNSRVQD